jgi:hypothetical protein
LSPLQIKIIKMATTPNAKITKTFGAPLKNSEMRPHTPLKPIPFNSGEVMSVLELHPPTINGKEPKVPSTPFTVHCLLNSPKKEKPCPPLKRREEKIHNYVSPLRRKKSSDQITPQGEQSWNTKEQNSTPEDLKSLLREFFHNCPSEDQTKRLKRLRASYTPPKK